jgi:hypothetical protein
MKQLAFAMQPQLMSNWCWSAVGTSVAMFYNPASGVTQCTLAGAELGGDCCNDPAPCNQDWFLDRALLRVGHLQLFAGGAQLLGTVQQVIDQDQPLGVRIQWAGGGGHFVVISGYDEAASVVTVEDPLNLGPVIVDYATFVSSYQGVGSWSHSYFTQ